jgi:hypothetical protein
LASQRQLRSVNLTLAGIGAVNYSVAIEVCYLQS